MIEDCPEFIRDILYNLKDNHSETIGQSLSEPSPDNNESNRSKLKQKFKSLFNKKHP